MVYEEDREWMPSNKWRRKHSLEDTTGPRELLNIRRAKTHTLEKIQEIKRTENLSTDVDDAAVFTNIFEKFQSHHVFSSVDFSHSEPKPNNSVDAINNVLLPKAPLTLLKRDIIHKWKLNLTRPKLGPINNAQRPNIKQERAYCSKAISQHHMIKERRITNKAFIQMLQRRRKKDNQKNKSKNRKRIKPRLSVTIPENKLFPQKKYFMERCIHNKAKQSMVKKNETENKNNLKEMKTKSLKKVRELNKEEVAQTKNDKNQKSGITSKNNSNKLHLQLESLSNSELPIGLCNKVSIDADVMANSPAQKTANVSYTFDKHFAAIQQILKNLAVKGNNKAHWKKDQGHDSDEDDRDESFPKENSYQRCYRIDDKDKSNDKLVLKFKRMSNNTQMKAEMSKENKNLKIIEQPEGNSEENVTITKNLSLNSLKKIDYTNTEFDKPMIDVTGSKGIQFIDYCYRSILKDITSKMDELLEFSFGTVMTEIKAKEENGNCQTPKGTLSSSIIKKPVKDILSVKNIIYNHGNSCSKDSSRMKDALLKRKSAGCHDQGNPYEQLYEDFTKYYNNVFDNDTNVICSKMGELLEYIVAKEDLLFVKQVNVDHNISHSAYITGNIYNQIGQDKIKNLNRLFLQIYEKICNVTDNRKQRKILLIAWFVKIKSRISSLANRTWTLKETRLHLITFLSQDTLHLPLVGEVFFRQEEAFLQDCMMVIDYTLKCESIVQESRKEFHKPQENEERIASPKSHHVSTDNQCSFASTNIVQYPNAEPLMNFSNSLKDVLENSQKPIEVNNNVTNCNISNTSEETSNNGQCKKPPCENELHLGKESPKDTSSCHGYEESPYTEKQKGPCHLNNCNKNVNIEGQAKKISTLVQTLYEAYKNSSAEKLEKLAEHIRIGDIELNYASCKIMQMLRETGNFDEQYTLLKKIDALIKEV